MHEIEEMSHPVAWPDNRHNRLKMFTVPTRGRDSVIQEMSSIYSTTLSH